VSASKTEEPTPKRLRRAREEGDSGASAYASQAVGLVVAVMLAPAAVAAAAERVGSRLEEAIAAAASESPSALIDLPRAVLDVVALSFPVLVAVAIAASAAQLVQTGGSLATRRLGLRLDRLNPFDGMAALLTRVRLLSLARALLGAALVGWFVIHALRTHAGDLARATGRLAYVGGVATALSKTVAWDAGLAGLALAAIDLVLVRFDWKRRLRMSKDEVKRESRESLGDPEMKRAREQARRELIAAVPIEAIVRASVVVAAPALPTCALRYAAADGDAAPIVVATGDGAAAAELVRMAREHGVHVVHDATLARALAPHEIGDAISEDLYDAVAEILRDVM